MGVGSGIFKESLCEGDENAGKEDTSVPSKNHNIQLVQIRILSILMGDGLK